MALVNVEDRILRSNTRDTKRWCKGKEGAEHQFTWVFQFADYRDRDHKQWEQQVCSVCGRKAKWRLGTK
jgi:hypothetical protein